MNGIPKLKFNFNTYEKLINLQLLEKYIEELVITIIIKSTNALLSFFLNFTSFVTQLCTGIIPTQLKY